jgi:SAM-dependent methyltransferase
MGRWSARLAPLFLDFAQVAGAQRLLDVGCGTGTLAKAIHARNGATVVVGIDPAWEFIRHLHQEIAGDRAWFHLGDAQCLPYPDSVFDGALGLLVFQEMADPERAIGEWARVTRPGGTVATCRWDFMSGMTMFSTFWDAVTGVDPDKVAERAAKKAARPPIASEQAFADFWRNGGLCEVETGTVEITQDFANFDDYWMPFLSDATPGSSYVSTLPPEDRDALKTDLRQRLLGDRPDGPFTLPARALVVRGNVPKA